MEFVKEFLNHNGISSVELIFDLSLPDLEVGINLAIKSHCAHHFVLSSTISKADLNTDSRFEIYRQQNQDNKCHQSGEWKF
ncbi:hypothetical protein MRB53_013018 [Persea americana]|uniref:Uncharacterized protein n=1 Tax=Persea americana TaxID=3435 RepID=A0ACC2M096_PERAE|nr:hypothetical protein MRB53_013018 [Persea americana]